MSSMNLKKRLIWSPTIIGIVLFVVSRIDLYLFISGVLDIKTVLGWEVVIVMLGLISSVVVFSYGIYLLIKKHWKLAMYAFISSVSFFILYGVGGVFGAAYLNAT